MQCVLIFFGLLIAVFGGAALIGLTAQALHRAGYGRNSCSLY